MTAGYQPTASRVHVKIGTRDGVRRDLYFGAPFRIGRQETCEVCIPDEYVSRTHAEVFFHDGQWWVRDLQSSGGLFVRGERIEYAPVSGTVVMRLGSEGPIVALEVENAPAPPPEAQPPLPPDQSAVTNRPTLVTQQPANPNQPTNPNQATLNDYLDHYFSDSNQPAGDHTRMIRMAFQQVQKTQKRKYGKIMAGLGIAVLAAGVYALYLHQQVRKQRAMAQDIFYAMKSLDVNIAHVETLVLDSHNQQGMAEVQRYREQRKEMEKNYDQFLSTLRVYKNQMSEPERLILRVTRIFGECELAMPPDFVSEVQAYIKKWQSSGRYAAAIRAARENGYTEAIAKELLAQDLPPQFFYLALQESGFDAFASGPMTRKGIAKGMWQFIPQTAVKYGLRVGPLADLRRPDPGDDRHHFDRETKAASRYLKDLYTTDAQASGLLVMSCYNWGEDYVLPLVRSMSPNPKDRNFWRLLAKYRDKLPKETYDYVFYIVSAAVIGENPRLFGFDFDNPLASLETR